MGNAKMLSISVLITCHNRRDKTIECLTALYEAAKHADARISTIVVDDGSRDGTADAVSSQFPSVELIAGAGNLFWNRGTFVAFERALQTGYDAYIWLNDDSVLYPHALEVGIQTWRDEEQKGNQVIVVGSMQDPKTGQLTYGGVIRKNWLQRFKYTLVPPGAEALPCDTMNGNFVLVPDAVARCVGNLDYVFEHAMGDTDYGLRAQRKGYRVLVAPGFVGCCARNGHEGTYMDKASPLLVRLNRMRSPKGLPVRSWWRFTKRHGGLLSPLYWLWPYLKLCVGK